MRSRSKRVGRGYWKLDSSPSYVNILYITCIVVSHSHDVRGGIHYYNDDVNR